MHDRQRERSTMSGRGQTTSEARDPVADARFQYPSLLEIGIEWQRLIAFSSTLSEAHQNRSAITMMDRADALRQLASTLPVESIDDVAVQLAVASSIVESLDANELSKDQCNSEIDTLLRVTYNCVRGATQLASKEWRGAFDCGRWSLRAGDLGRGAASAADPPGNGQDLDAELLATCLAFDQLERADVAAMLAADRATTPEQLEQQPFLEAESARLSERKALLVERMCELPALTMAGLVARARSLALWDAELLKDERGDIGTRLTAAVVRDLLLRAA